MNMSPLRGSQKYQDMKTSTNNPLWQKVRKAYENAKDEKSLAAAHSLQKEIQDNMTADELKAFNEALIKDTYALLSTGDKMIEEYETEKVRKKLGELPEAISLSYIAKNYFGKSRSWLLQRINGNKVNGKEAHFNSGEILQLQNALHDLGKKLSSVALI